MNRPTIDCYKSRVVSLLENYPNPTESDIKNYLYLKQQTGFMSGTIANYVKSFRSFFSYLLNNSLFDLDYQRLKIPKIRYRERYVLTDDEIKKLFQIVTNAEDRLMLLLLVDCGLRVTELATIKLKNINWDDESILIKGKGGKSRIVSLSDTTVNYLKQHVIKLDTEYLFSPRRCDTKKNILIDVLFRIVCQNSVKSPR